ncbi:MAG: hypothetical protein PUE65_02145 [Mollicutes bacterium]|nr:hypothetical protein [Mollicutes bacterium]
MAGIRFTDEQVSMLRSNPWVKSVTPKYVSFTKEFMEEFIDLHSKGQTRYEIFESHGLPVDVLGKSSIENSTGNWVKKANKSIGLSDEKRGRPRTKDLTQEEIIARQKAKIEMLQQENDFLRQIRRLERRHQPSKSPSKKGSR